MKVRGLSGIPGIAVFIVAFALLGGTASASDPGDISPPGGSNDWCVSEDGTDGIGTPNGCLDGIGLGNGVAALQVSPDNKRLFVLGFDSFSASTEGDSITTFDRSLSRGSLTADPRINACRSAFLVPDCSQGGSQATFLQAPNGLAISPDNNQVYVSARRTHSVTVFDYLAIDSPLDPVGQQGPLARKASPNGCVTEGATVGCLNARGLSTASDVAISPDGNTIYTAGRHFTGGIAVFDRASDGVLTQKAGTAGCVNDNGDSGCSDGNHLMPTALTISADGKNLYAVSVIGPLVDSVTVFDVAADGTITQKAGLAGCFTESGSGGACTPTTTLGEVTDISVTPDGKNVYVTSDADADPGAVTVFDRNTVNGELTRPAGAAGCFAVASVTGCTEAVGLYKLFGVTATDEAVYISSLSDGGSIPAALVVLNRDPDTGVLDQKPFEGCWAADEVTDCAELSTLAQVRAVAVSPDGDSLYAGSSNGITVFNRNDGTNPDSTIESGPTGETVSADASFTFSGDKPDLYFECSLDSTDFWLPCDSPQEYTNLSLGQHTFRVRATDVFDQVETAPTERTWTVVNETDPPETAINSGPQGDVTATSASFTFSSDEAGTFECRIDEQAFAACTSPEEYSGLALGAHNFQVRAIDLVGNIDATPAERNFTVVKERVDSTCETNPGLCPDTKVDAVVTAAKLQKQKGKTIVVAVKIRANEALTANLSGSVRKGKHKAAFKPVTQPLKAGSTNTIKLRPARNGPSRLVAAALLGGKRAVPKIFITMTDGATNRLVVKPKIKIQGAPKRR